MSTQKKDSQSWLKKFCCCSLPAATERDAHRQEIIIAILMLTGSVIVTGLSLWDIIDGDGVHRGNVITLVVGLLATASYIAMLMTYKTCLCVTIVFMAFLHFFWLITSEIELTGMFWCLVMLPLFFYMLGHKSGKIVVTVLFLSSVIILLQPKWLTLPVRDSTDTSYRFLLAYLVLCLVSFLVEYVRFQTRQYLEEVRDSLKLQARTDELTGLANRRGFRQFLGEAEKRSDNSKGSFAVIIGDLDHFKQINDQYGHEVGDFVLKDIAKILKLSLIHISEPTRPY